ncbi:hypothetical protein ABBQ32_006519 [Trebouxia sp. C0010 RCD-2024]
MVNFGMFHLLDKARTASFNTAVNCLLQQPWVVFSCQIQTATDKQDKVSTLQFATEGGDVYIFDCLALGVQAIHEHGLAWLLQSPTLRKIMYSSDNTAAALWRQLRVQVVNAVDLQALTTPPNQWPSFNKACTDVRSDMHQHFTGFSDSTLARSCPIPISTQEPKLLAGLTPTSISNLHRAGQKTHHVSVDANSQKSGRGGHESPQAVLDLMLDELESDALSNPCDILYHFTSEPPAPPPSVQRSGASKQGRGRCSSMGSMSLLDSMQLMELPILPGEDGSVAEEYVEDKLNEGERFNWLARPLASDALDYAAAEAKTILRLYQQVMKDSKYAASIMDSQASVYTSGDVFGTASPNSVYKQQQVERRKLLAEVGDKQSCPIVVPAKQGEDASRRGHTNAKKPRMKCTSWRMPCMS